MAKLDVTLGIDIGGTNTAFGLIDSMGKKHVANSIPTNPGEPAELLFKRLYYTLNTRDTKNYKIVGVGIGAPNANYFKGTVENPPNLKWEMSNVVDLSKQFLDIPTVCTNDANAAALGELKFGAAKKMKNFIEITLGTGLGSGIIINGEMLYGSTGFAGELGHVIVKPGGRKCGCGRRGCLETYASATGIVRTVSELLGEYKNESELRNVSYHSLTAKKIFEIAKQGDKIAKEAFERTAKVLGSALADVAAVLSPEAIIIFGGLAQAGELLFSPLKKHMNSHMLNIFKSTVKVLPSKLPAGDAAIIGASALAWNELDKLKKNAECE